MCSLKDEERNWLATAAAGNPHVARLETFPRLGRFRTSAASSYEVKLCVRQIAAYVFL